MGAGLMGAALVSALVAGACRRESRSDAGGAAAGRTAPGVAGSAARAAASAAASAASGGETPFPGLRAWGLAEARAVEPAAAAMLAAVEQGRLADARRAYGVLRQRARRVEPLTRRLAPLASSQLGAYGFFDPEEAGPLAGLNAAGRLLREASPDHGDLVAVARRLHAAARLLAAELESQEWSPQAVGLSVAEGAFVLGARLDGSDSFDEEERWSDAAAEVAGMSDALLTTGLALEPPEAQAGVAEALATLRARVAPPAPDGSRGASALAATVASGQLGARLRQGFERAGSPPLSPPFRARDDRGLGRLAPVSVLTFPALTGAPPDAREAALGHALFASTLLSRTRTVACASCHDEARAFAHADPPAVTFDRKAPARNAPGLWNVAYEPFLFWDGRASTLVAQIDVAVDRDMGGDWAEVERRLAGDARLTELAGAEPLTAARVRRAIVAYERTLIDDGSRLDRAVRGELTLDPDESRGLDLFLGAARCSRCHRPPLLSGVVPPRFLRAELSSIGVPTKPEARSLDADTGRHALTRRDEDRGLFKAPGLRRVAETAPYFHHGGFRTLEQVVDLYIKGGGPGLGLDVPNLDPELRPVALSAAQRSDLLVFLRRTLSH